MPEDRLTDHTHNDPNAGAHTHDVPSAGAHTHDEPNVGAHTHDEPNAGAHTHDEPNAGAHTHNHPNARAVSNRLARAIGHLESVKRMVDEGEDCAQILIQLAAVRSAINNAGKVLLSDHINHCIVEAVENKDYEKIEELNEAIQKFVK
ncbi:MAG: metal-sensing transcriptional repressor [Clostridiales bacterium]|nr:metal-sensing transcriptional repressor [Clostridiales bacterium]